MSIQIIGVGLGRTGTLLLKAALEELGFAKCYHMVEVFTRRCRVTIPMLRPPGRRVERPRPTPRPPRYVPKRRPNGKDRRQGKNGKDRRQRN